MSRRKHVVLRLIGTLFTSPYRWQMLILQLLSFLFLGLQLVVTLKLAGLAGAMTDALVQRDATAFYTALLGLFGMIVAMLLVMGIDLYLDLRLKMQARTALTYAWLNQWLGEEGLYRLEREKLIDNPDQRIAEDLEQFLQRTLSLLMGAVGAIGGVWMFSTQLWQKGGSLDLNLGGESWSIPGYLFWFALAYSIFDFILTRWIAKPQIGLNMEQQHFEADFRFSLVQVRENAEQIAFYRGEETEFKRLLGCFEKVRQNWWRLISYQAGLNVYNSATGHFSTYSMYFLLAPRVLAGAVTVGTMTQMQALYGNTLSKLNWLANAWPSIVQWLAVVRRLKEMDAAIGQPPRSGITLNNADTAALSTRDLVLALPDGSALAAIGYVCIQPGQRWLVRGPSGTGKSTLVRAIAGLWPHGSGSIAQPRGHTMFLPQKTYLPWDTLKVVLAYPKAADTYSDEECRQALIDCRLPRLAGELYEQARWNMRLSLGEQQRLAFARALLARPDFLFLDESTSALDLDTEHHLYELLIERLPNTALISVAHRQSLEALHTHSLDLHAERLAQIATLGVTA